MTATIFEALTDRLTDEGARRKVLAEMGERVLDAWTENIRTSGHGGWPPLSPYTIFEKTMMGYPLTPLIRTWRLSQSFNRGGADNVFLIEGDSITVGTRVPYARRQADGDPSTRLPARDFTELLPQVYESIHDAVAQQVAG